MKAYRYLIIGGGLAGDGAARGIRELDSEGTIGILSMEPDPPYARPNLSKGLWKGRPLEKIWRNTENLGVEMHLSRKAVELDPARKKVRDDQGGEYSYEKLLLATGGAPIRLPFGGDDIIYFRNLRHYQRLRALTERGEHFLVIGGGFIGSEIAAALTMVGKKVSMLFLENGIGARIFPPDLSRHLNTYYTEKGVEVLPEDSVVEVSRRGDRIVATSKSGRTFEVDGVVGGIGIRPNLELATQAGLRVDHGIVVNRNLLTSAADVYSAGDVASFLHAGLGKRVRVEHEDNAIFMGKQAGRNMAGANETYDHVPFFYSDLFDLGYEAVGELDSRLETVADWQDGFNKGVVYYLEGGRVRGILLWNVWEKVQEARLLLAEPGPFEPADLTARL